MNRLQSLDWLRGLLALSIMVYHLTGWTLYQPQSDELLGRLGIYGVSMFFVLSGLAMAAGYARLIHDARSSLRFLVRRLFRIWPLLWLAVAAATVGSVLLKGQAVNWPLVLLNVTTAFGFVAPGSYINTGAWSIGNEMVYYALTPALIAVYNRSLAVGNVVVACTAAIAAYIAYGALTPAATLASQWLLYINPFNNLVLYAAGIAIFYNADSLEFGRSKVLALMAGSVAVLALYPAEGDLINVVTGTNRIVFCAVSVSIVLSFYKFASPLPRWLALPLAALGAATYGIYLLHPIVFPIVELALRRLNLHAGPFEKMAATIVLTIAVSMVLYRRLELPLIQLGKRLTADRSAGKVPALLSSGSTRAS